MPFVVSLRIAAQWLLGMIVVAAEVFKTAFIPQKLADIDHYEREIIKMTSKGDSTGCARSPYTSHHSFAAAPPGLITDKKRNLETEHLVYVWLS
eukprot:COSAG02_NODE_4327_length_5497_cov_934.755465_5_plen_94_part_00